MEAHILEVVVVAAKRYCHPVAYGCVSNRLDALSGPAAVDPTFLEGPHGTDYEYVPPVRGQWPCDPTRFQVDCVASQTDSGAGQTLQQPQVVHVGTVSSRKVRALNHKGMVVTQEH